MKDIQYLKNLLGHNVKVRRANMNWNQGTLAKKTGVSKNTISEIETGQKFVGAETLISLASALNTEVYELFKPDDVLPDTNREILMNYVHELREAIELIDCRYWGSQRKLPE